MSERVLPLALLAFALAFASWLALSLTIVGGRVWYDVRRRESSGVVGPRAARRLIRRASRRPRTDWGRSRHVAAISRLARVGHPAAPRLLRRAVDDPDRGIASAAVRALGAIGDAWAVDLLVTALRRGRVSRSQIAAQLDRLAPRIGPSLLPLMQDEDPTVRFWGATLLGPYPELGQASLIALTRDPDANVRAAAVETLGGRHGEDAARATLALLHDSAWFVRVHAARSAGHVVGAAASPELTRLLGDERWWVRTAAKDALRSIGRDAISALLPVLTSPDEFARNGAAEVLQDVGFVDHLADEEPASPLLERIYVAGGQRLRDAAETRARGRKPAKEARAA